MHTHRLILQPLSAFGTPLAGDTLFGQLCWTLRHQYGNVRLSALLEGYGTGQPFAVFSDAMPQGYLPLPSLPGRFWQNAPVDRKILKKKRWLPLDAFKRPLAAWQAHAHNDTEATHAIAGTEARPAIERAQPHNSINRQTGTTGTGQFAPYSQSQQWFDPAMRFHLHVCLDHDRLSLDALLDALNAMGATGYGRDASIGLGKFRVAVDLQTTPPETAANSNAWLTLGPCAPQNQGFVAERSYYQPLTRFGRHGDMAVHGSNPFKRPVILARAGSVFTPENFAPRLFIGQGLTHVSSSQPETVQQGYAPVIGICLPTD